MTPPRTSSELSGAPAPSPARPRRWLLHTAVVGGLIALACSSHKTRTLEDVALESSDRFSSVLQGVVGDPDRAAAVGAVFATYQAEQQRFAADMADLKATALASYQAYDTTDEDFDALEEQLRSRREAFRDDIAGGIADLLAVLEPGEWTETVGLMLEEEARWKEANQ
ncbi:MAG: hypothetical protein P8M11_12295 [Planctomycetota bacterium]|nr:hypothetical protein [Planctomycetota bacterium]MDG1985342.1 hypothetical protein [Planctomycetota bacterium]